MSTDAKPRRRWFSFSLRTLFVVVTLVGAAAAWVAYQLNWISERHAYLAELRRRPEIARDAQLWEKNWLRQGFSDAPSELRIFGEQGIAEVLIYVTPDEIAGNFHNDDFVWDSNPRVARAARLFPEAAPEPYWCDAATPEIRFLAIEAERDRHRIEPQILPAKSP